MEKKLFIFDFDGVFGRLENPIKRIFLDEFKIDISPDIKSYFFDKRRFHDLNDPAYFDFLIAPQNKVLRENNVSRARFKKIISSFQGNEIEYSDVLVKQLNNAGHELYILSSGLKELILNRTNEIGFNEGRIYCNEFSFDSGCAQLKIKVCGNKLAAFNEIVLMHPEINPKKIVLVADSLFDLPLIKRILSFGGRVYYLGYNILELEKGIKDDNKSNLKYTSSLKQILKKELTQETVLY